MSIEDLMERDNKNNTANKVKGSIIDHSVIDNTQNNDSIADYQGNASMKSSMMIQPNRARKLTRGNSVTSLYSQEKERKSVSIRRSRSKTNSVVGRTSSMGGANSDDTTQSLERMYTFNLSHMQKQVPTKTGKGAKKDSPAGVPAGEDAIDIRPIDMKAVKNNSTTAISPSGITADSSKPKTVPDGVIIAASKPTADGPEEETKGSKTERTRSQASLTKPQGPQANPNFCPTYQVLERTNIQEK